MFVAAYHNTMAGARRIVPEPTPRRDRLVAAAAEWRRRQDEHDAMMERRRAIAVAMIGKMPVPQPPARPNEIIAQVAAWHGVSAEAIISPSRKRHVIEARFDAIAAVWLNCPLHGERRSICALGRIFGGRDHSTVRSALVQRGLL